MSKYWLTHKIPTVAWLRGEASRKKIKGRSKLNKSQLVKVLRLPPLPRKKSRKKSVKKSRTAKAKKSRRKKSKKKRRPVRVAPKVVKEPEYSCPDCGTPLSRYEPCGRCEKRRDDPRYRAVRRIRGPEEARVIARQHGW